MSRLVCPPRRITALTTRACAGIDASTASSPAAAGNAGKVSPPSPGKAPLQEDRTKSPARKRPTQTGTQRNAAAAANTVKPRILLVDDDNTLRLLVWNCGVCGGGGCCRWCCDDNTIVYGGCWSVFSGLAMAPLLSVGAAPACGGGCAFLAL